jgi:isopentenyl-diphosphate Delta-isomerase
VYLLKYDLKLENLKIQKEEVEELKFIPIEIFDKEIHDVKLSKKYVLQSQEYYNKVISEIKKRLGFML